jgi:NADH-quinone oxidoreductase subunit G
MIADEMGTPINLPTVAATAREIAALGNWDGAAISFEKTSAVKSVATEGKMNLNSWRLLLDLGTLQDGEANLAGTARKASARISKTRAEKIGVSEGELVSISSELGSLKLPVEISEMADSDIWVPRNSIDSQVIANLGFVSGQVTVAKHD